MSKRRTRERQLAKLAERRAAERRRKRRQRVVAATVAIVVALAGMGFGLYVLTRKPKKAAAAPTPTPTASAAEVACGGTVPAGAGRDKPQFKKPPKMTIDQSKTYTMVMETSCGTIRLRLDPEKAPNTVNSLVFLARRHFFDGLIFHRIVKNFVIQGGDPSGDGTGGPGYKTVDPPPKKFQYAVGDLAMAKGGSEAAGTAGSQFFIVTGDPRALNASHDYAIVGHVIAGQDIAKQIEQLPAVNGANDGKPQQTVYIVKVTIKVS